MKKSIFYFTFLLLTGISINSQAMETVYNNDSKELSISGLKIDGDDVLYDVKVKLEGYELLSPLQPTPAACPAQSASNFMQITNGMTLDQVNSIIGCEGALLETDFDDGLLKTKYVWKFDNTTNAASIVLAFEQNILIL